MLAPPGEEGTEKSKGKTVRVPVLCLQHLEAASTVYTQRIRLSDQFLKSSNTAESFTKRLDGIYE